jgi:hypothetical protein
MYTLEQYWTNNYPKYVISSPIPLIKTSELSVSILSFRFRNDQLCMQDSGAQHKNVNKHRGHPPSDGLMGGLTTFWMGSLWISRPIDNKVALLVFFVQNLRDHFHWSYPRTSRFRGRDITSLLSWNIHVEFNPQTTLILCYHSL